MKRRLIIIGAGGHGRVCAEIGAKVGYDDISFLDDNVYAHPGIIGRASDFKDHIEDSDFFVAIGNCSTREKIFEMIEDAGGRIATLIHPFTAISPSAKIGCGSVAVAGAVVNAGTVIGKGVILNTSSSVDHDCVIGDFSHISAGTHVTGTVSVGKRVFLGAGASTVNNVSVCDDCIVGAGAVVINDIEEAGTYVGVPARRIK